MLLLMTSIIKCEKNKTGFSVHWLHDNMVFYSHVLMHCDMKEKNGLFPDYTVLLSMYDQIKNVSMFICLLDWDSKCSKKHMSLLLTFKPSKKKIK